MSWNLQEVSQVYTLFILTEFQDHINILALFYTQNYGVFIIMWQQHTDGAFGAIKVMQYYGGVTDV